MREWLKLARTARNMTMADLADKLNITESYYSYIENGARKKKLDIVFVVRLSEVLGISISDIIRFEAELSEVPA